MNKNKVYYFRFLSVFLIFLIQISYLGAQTVSNINIDQLTDAQLLQLMQTNNLSGLKESELELKAKEKGFSSEQIGKLNLRMQALNSTSVEAKQESKKDETNIRKPGSYILPKSMPDYINGLMIYGSDIFTKENLTFEPNLTIPTPRNYILGAGDEIKIDIYGFSDKSQFLKVTPDGFIRYPNIGPIKVAGLSLDELKSKLTFSISKLYPGLKGGNTNLQLSLGQIRSIKVNLIGEISKPGTYSVPSLSTIANALYAAGGPTKIGSYRNIELVRVGKVVSRFDLYEFLLKGDLTKNIILQDDDVIKVSSYTSRVELRGAVKREAIYELSQNDKMTDLFIYSGGLADNANKTFYRVIRFGNQEREVFTVKSEELTSFKMQTGDQVYIDSIANIYNNRVKISGAVYYQGNYSIGKVKTLKDALSIAIPTEISYKDRAILVRLQQDFTPRIIGFNINDVLNGKFNLDLIREDSIYIYSKDKIKEKFTFKVIGEINTPNTFPFVSGIRIQDAILMAGGYKDAASRKFVEVSRRIRDSIGNIDSSLYSIALRIDLEKDKNEELLNSILEPFDIVTIRKAPFYKQQISVTIEGEVLYPGNYTITSNKERLLDLVKRAGGLKNGAYPEGSFMLRKTFEDVSLTDTVILKNKIATLKSTSEDTVKGKKSDSTFKDELKIVGIRLKEVLIDSNSLFNIILQDGDILKVPKKVETVQTFSGVYLPKKIIYQNGLSLKEIIRESGGVLPNGLKKKAYVIYPNGEVRTTKRYVLFNIYPKIKPGSEIYVPLKKEGKGMSTAELIGITTGLATLATMIITLSRL